MLNLDNYRDFLHVSLVSESTLDMCGFVPEDDPASMCPSLVVDEVYSPDENCYWPVLRCRAILDAEMLLNNESCDWISWYRYSHYKDVNDVCDDELPF